MNHVIAHIMVAVLHWLAVHTGTSIPAGQYSDYYNFWSGFGSDLAEFGIIGGMVHIWLNTRCHVDGCYRHGRFPFHHYKLCRLHHPAVPAKINHLHIVKLHRESVR
jgi:hypothetical protein